MNSSEVAAAKFAGVRLASPGQHRATTTVVSSPNTVIGVYTIEVCVGKSHQFQFAYIIPSTKVLCLCMQLRISSHIYTVSQKHAALLTHVSETIRKPLIVEAQLGPKKKIRNAGICPIDELLWNAASPRKISLKSGNRLLSYDQKEIFNRPSAILN